jgi:hypothetical protein
MVQALVKMGGGARRGMLSLTALKAAAAAATELGSAAQPGEQAAAQVAEQGDCTASWSLMRCAVGHESSCAYNAWCNTACLIHNLRAECTPNWCRGMQGTSSQEQQCTWCTQYCNRQFTVCKACLRLPFFGCDRCVEQ